MHEVVLLQSNFVCNQNQQKSGILYAFMTNKSYAYLLNVQQSNLVFSNTNNAGFGNMAVKFTERNGRPLEMEFKVHLVLLWINRDDTSFDRTKNKKKLFQKILIFIICKKSI